MRYSKVFYLLLLLSLLAMLTTIAPTPAQADKKPSKPHIAWDWTGIIGTGQSLSVGAHGVPPILTTQPYNNLKLSTDDLPWPIDPNDPKLTMVPLTEPVGRLSTSYPSSWPTNIDGETPHTAMADELTALVRANFNRDFVSVHSAVGEDGQGMIFIRKNPEHRGVNGHSYQAALIETTAIARLAKAAGKTYGVGAIVVTHGETDAGNRDYENELHQLWQDYNGDLAAITGQKQDVLMIVSQQNTLGDHSPSTLAQWKCGADYPDHMVCSGPKYQYPYFTDHLHLTAQGYDELGEKYAEVYYERVILGKKWLPLEPTGAERSGPVIMVHFHVPVGPLVWDGAMDPPHPSVPEWQNGKGFEVATSAGAKVAIQSVAIAGDSVVITCASDPGPNSLVSYAMVGEPLPTPSQYGVMKRWGLLRDSDPFVGVSTKVAQPNYCVAFDWTVK